MLQPENFSIVDRDREEKLCDCKIYLQRSWSQIEGLGSNIPDKGLSLISASPLPLLAGNTQFCLTEFLPRLFKENLPRIQFSKSNTGKKKAGERFPVYDSWMRVKLSFCPKKKKKLRNRISQVSMDSGSECLQRCIDQNSVNGLRSISPSPAPHVRGIPIEDPTVKSIPSKIWFEV